MAMLRRAPKRLRAYSDHDTYHRLWTEPDMLEALTTRDVTKIYRRLQRYGLSQRRIASRTQQSQSEIGEILAGRRVESYSLLVRIADGLGIPRGYMGLSYTDLPTPPPDRDAASPHQPAQSPELFRTIDPYANAHLPQQRLLPMSTVPLWTGREVRMLREARRMSVREFAAHLGVSDRMVSKWEAGSEGIRPRPLNQAALDTSLAQADADTKQRFAYLTLDPDSSQRPSLTAESAMTDKKSAGYLLVRHPFDGKLMSRVDSGPYRAGGRQIWLPSYYIDLHPVTIAEFARFKATTSRTSATPAATLTSQESGEPDPADFTPVHDFSLTDAYEYARWTAKQLSTANQWDQARKNGLVIPHGLWEWCHTDTGPTKRAARSAQHGTFRCTTPAADLLGLLAI